MRLWKLWKLLKFCFKNRQDLKEITFDKITLRDMDYLKKNGYFYKIDYKNKKVFVKFK